MFKRFIVAFAVVLIFTVVTGSASAHIILRFNTVVLYCFYDADRTLDARVLETPDGEGFTFQIDESCISPINDLRILGYDAVASSPLVDPGPDGTLGTADDVRSDIGLVFSAPRPEAAIDDTIDSAEGLYEFLAAPHSEHAGAQRR